MNIVYANDAAAGDFQLDKHVLAQTPLFELFEDCSNNQASIISIQRGIPVQDAEFKMMVGNSLIWVALSSVMKATGGGGEPDAYFSLRDITRKKKQERLITYLNSAVKSIVTTRDTKTSLQRIADFVVPAFADWFTIDILQNEEFKLILLKHQDNEKIEWAKQYRKKYPFNLKAETGAAAVVKTGKPNFVPVLTDEMIDMGMPDPVQREEIKKIGLHSVIMAPMSTNGQTTGVVNFISSQPDRHFDEEDLHFALNFADVIALALENSRLHEEDQQEIVLRRQGEERFRFWLDAIPHKMWTSGPDGEATYYNQQWYDYTGIPGFENLRKQIWDIIHPDDRVDAAVRWPEAVKTGDFIEMENRFRRHDGVYRWHLSRVNPIKDEKGHVALWVGTSTDIHEQKTYEIELASANEEMMSTNEELSAANEELEAATEEQSAANQELRQTQNDLRKAINNLEESKKRFQIFLDSIPQIAWANSPSGDVIFYNKRWYDYTGLTFEETKNWGWKKIIHPDDLDYNLAQLSSITQSSAPGEFEVREKRNDGEYRWHLVRLSPLLGPAGQPEQWIGTATDIEDLKMLQQQKDDFISIASHELKTPLTSLKAIIQVLHKMKDKVLPEKFPQLIEQANRNMHKLTTLVDALLNVNRVKGNLTLQKKRFILSELINACCNHITIVGTHKVLVRGDKSAEVYADESAIDQVIVNFVNNAVKYAPESKDIVVLIEQMAKQVKLSVSDKGPGISPEQLPYIFNRYFQAGKQNYRNPGLGLGLYISSEIIKRHGGDIGVESEPGKGTTFWFTLPR